MWLLRLAIKSASHRAVSTSLCVLTVSLSVGLYLGIENLRTAIRDSFEGTINQTDLIVGARGGSAQLLLYSVFQMGQATNNISYKSFETYQKHPAVKWAVPLSLGDSHRGYRVLATSPQYFEHYRFHGDRQIDFESGKVFSETLDVVVGSEVARELKYSLGQKLVLTHGSVVIDDGSQDHEKYPFQIVGIIKKTGTPLDRLLFVSLSGFEAMHDNAGPVKLITSFLVGVKTKRDSIFLQREINEYKAEPLMAILPGATLSELWRILAYVEDALRAMSLLVVLLGMFSILIAIYTTLNERRREIAILRAVGLSPFKIFFLLILESSFLSVLGVIGGIFLMVGLLKSFNPWIFDLVGVEIPLRMLHESEWLALGCFALAGAFVGLLPAIKAYRTTLNDGLSAQV